MKLVYAMKKVIQGQKSIFLAGGTIRVQNIGKSNLKSWRTQVIDQLKKIGYDGTIYIPQFTQNKLPQGWTLEKQIQWQTKALNNATVIMFWIPRDLKLLPCFTTNFEFGQWYKSGKVVVGAPTTAQKNEYLQYKAQKQAGIEWHTTINSLCQTTKEMVDKL